MGKFNPTTTGGEVSTLDAASVQLPVTPAPEQAPAGGSILDTVMAEEVSIPTDLTAPSPELAAQQEIDRVPSLKERQEAQDTGRYDFQGDMMAAEQAKAQQAMARQANDTPQPDGGFQTRALNFQTALDSKDLPGLGGLGTRGTGIVKQSYEKAGLVTPDGQWTPQAGLVMSAVTENFLADRAHADEATIDDRPAFTKSAGRARLGQAINNEKARLEGREPTPLSNEEAEALGDTAQELYYEINKGPEGDQFMIRTEIGEGDHKQVAFQLTQKGSDLLTIGAAKRKRLFPKQHVRTQKAPLGRVTPEARQYTRPVSSKTGVSSVNSREQREALINLNSVANVVDAKRNKLLLALVLPTLKGQQQFDNDVMFLSADDMPGTTNNLAQDVYGIQLEKDGANYLTYYVQDFNGRMAPQQTSLDPTASKAARFVTRNAIPADTSNPRIRRNLIQMYGMHLVPDEFSPVRKPSGKRVPVDQLLPRSRQDVVLNPAVMKLLAGWGKAIKDNLDQIPDNQVQQVSEAIRNKQPVQQMPDVPPLQLPQKLVDFINSKGEDGMMVMDGLVDFYNWTEAEAKGKPHMSYFNATMDGKTNGIASNGIQMGSENVASKTGVIRSKNNNVQILDNGVDVRDDLELVLKGLADQGFDGKFSDNEIPVVREIANDIAGNRQFNKDITMTFGYGKEIASFKRDIVDMVSGDERAAGLDVDKVSDAIFTNYVPAMEQVMDEDALAARSVMRSAVTIAAWYNELFSMDAPLAGQKINLGATAPTGYLGKTGTAKVWTGEGYRDVGISQYGQEATSAAEKQYPPAKEGAEPEIVAGDVAYGGSIPGPVQSLDAATVTKTASGRSWERLKKASKGHPYIHTVYDAFKTDANGFDVVLEETNRNWLDLNMNWSYLESMAAATKAARNAGKEKFAGRPANSPLTDNEALMLRQWIVTDKDGKLTALANRFMNLMENPAQAADAAAFVKKEMIKSGYKANAQPTVGHLLAAINAIEKVLNVDSRLSSFANRTNAKKAKLKQEIKASAPSARDSLGYDLRSGAQYYAH